MPSATSFLFLSLVSFSLINCGFRRNTLLSWYSVILLKDYRRIFGSSSEAGQLDNVARRFAWFRRVLKTHEDENSILFPTSWNVGAVIAGGFSEVTRCVDIIVMEGFY